MKEKYLPVGSIVLLKDAVKRIVIVGYCCKAEKSDEVFDYCGYLFPEGVLKTSQVALFNHSQISQIDHMGLDDDEFKRFNQKLKDLRPDDSEIL